MDNIDKTGELSAAMLPHMWPLPVTSTDADKESRGRVLIVAGSAEIPGAAILAAEAALRAGAGKLTIATGASIARQVALAVPESRVIALPEASGGGLSAEGAILLEPLAKSVDCLLAGPGLSAENVTRAFVQNLLAHFESVPLILDAVAMNVAPGRRFQQPIALTPHAGELAHLTGEPKEQISRSPMPAARHGAQRWNAIVALKGHDTWLAIPDGHAWRHCGDNAGLATSGSGDVLAGLIAGYAARGLPLEQACGWGIVVHGLAGDFLSRQVGSVGYLARELLPLVPGLTDKLQAHCASSAR